ncbi:4-hydroxy-2-oxoheptanedioate aldolase [Rhodoligotrophos appendicifer]|uniref:aldolase/citrate lyase family protein n=1 Tax=Rhodoligotrophos appendicifer TaxID=987056 RepID=UPI00118629FB|nr:aldolase/citrate lyase family protein [Rhodoligotrophos appendicifer]
MAPRNPLLEKVKSGRTALGVWANDPQTVELCAHLGFDWIMIDMMFTGMDFGDVQNMIRTCEAAGITPVVRAHSNPWLGYDHRIAVDLSRLQGIGAQFVLVSHSGIQEIQEALEVAKDWHRRALWVHPFKSRDWEQRTDEMIDGSYIIPHAESQGSVDTLEETLDLPDLKMFFFAMTDLSKVLGNSKKPNWDSPELWSFVDRAVKKGKERGIVIGANTSYAYTMKEMRERVKRLHDAGVRFIMIQGAPFLFQVAMNEFLTGVRQDLGLEL